MRMRNSIISFFVILLCSFSSFGSNISWKANTTGNPANYAWTDVYTSSTFTMSLTAVAPLDLMEFDVKLDVDQVLLNWSTVKSEMRGFEIERTYDLNNWESIGFVEAVNKMSENKYSSIDKPAFQKLVYYRLKIIFK